MYMWHKWPKNERIVVVSHNGVSSWLYLELDSDQSSFYNALRDQGGRE